MYCRALGATMGPRPQGESSGEGGSSVDAQRTAARVGSEYLRLLGSLCAMRFARDPEVQPILF